MIQYSNRKAFRDFRKRLRNRSTSAEAELWLHLKGKKIKGRKFRRQHGIKNFIVDFYCSQERLIIELDGDYHGDYVKIEKDLERDQILNDLGYKVIRFENRFVFQNIEWVKEEIMQNFEP